jgi:hypothetical protein
MLTLIKYKLPYSNSDLLKISDMLRQADPIVTPRADFDPYNFLAYAEQRDIHKNRFSTLLDLNVISDVVRLCGQQEANESMRNTAALLGFLMVTDTLFDIGLAHTEFLQKHSIAIMRDNIHRFHIADNVDPRAYVDIALGRKTRLENSDIPAVNRNSDHFSPDLHYNWHLHYIELLKLSLITCDGCRSLKKLLQFVDWMWKDFMLSAPATMFAIIYLSPKPHGRMLKNSNSKDPDKVLLGIKNAAWDLVVAHFWTARVIESVNTDTLWLFCSFDRALRKIANNLLCPSDMMEQAEAKFDSLLSEYWPSTNASKISSAYKRYMDNARDPTRAIHRVTDQREFLPLVKQFEDQLRLEVQKRN